MRKQIIQYTLPLDALIAVIIKIMEFDFNKINNDSNYLPFDPNDISDGFWNTIKKQVMIGKI